MKISAIEAADVKLECLSLVRFIVCLILVRKASITPAVTFDLTLMISRKDSLTNMILIMDKCLLRGQNLGLGREY